MGQPRIEEKKWNNQLGTSIFFSLRPRGKLARTCGGDGRAVLRTHFLLPFPFT
jgi:hypothetical protein